MTAPTQTRTQGRHVAPPTFETDRIEHLAVVFGPESDWARGNGRHVAEDGAR